MSDKEQMSRLAEAMASGDADAWLSFLRVHDPERFEGIGVAFYDTSQSNQWIGTGVAHWQTDKYGFFPQERIDEGDLWGEIGVLEVTRDGMKRTVAEYREYGDGSGAGGRDIVVNATEDRLQQLSSGGGRERRDLGNGVVEFKDRTERSI